MKPDRELLEAAAKAAGISLEWGIFEQGWQLEPTSKCFYRDTKGVRREWKPLADDGDVFKLAVKLHMGVQVNGDDHWQTPNCTVVLFGEQQRLTQPHVAGALDDTRRAIVRAAAATVQD